MAESQSADLDASLSKAVSALMPDLKDELAQLVAIPSVSALDFPEETRPELLRASVTTGSSACC